MYWKSMAITLITMMLAGCVEPGLSTSKIVPFPGPSVDNPIRSVDYYKTHYKADLLSMDHNMQEEISISREGTDRLNRITTRMINVNGKTFPMKYSVAHLLRSKKIGNNDYVLQCDNITPIKIQEGDLLCWASCVQYLVFRAYHKVIDQNAIVDAVMKQKGSGDVPASVRQMMLALGLTGLRLTPNGATHLLETLGCNQPVMIGLRGTSKSDIGHAIIVAGARYSFANPYIPSMSPNANVSIGGILQLQMRQENNFAFNELYVLDPSPGKGETIHVEKANNIEDKIEFVLSFDVVDRY